MQAHETARVGPAKCGDDPRKVFGLAVQNACEITLLTCETQDHRAALLARRFILPPTMARAVAELHFMEAAR
jgi:hypothetical protein